MKDKVSSVHPHSFPLPVFCENNPEPVDVLYSNNPYSLWSLIRYDESGNIIWFISHWTDVVLTSSKTNEIFTVFGGKEKYLINEVYDVNVLLRGSYGSTIMLHLSGYGVWGNWEAKSCNCNLIIPN